jgi:hypothetical protein
MENNAVLDADLSVDRAEDAIAVEIVESGQFALLSFLSFGLYEIWWQYKMWRFFKQKENLDIMPAARALFAIFFLHALLEKIQDLAAKAGYQRSYSSGGLVLGFILFNVLSRLPEPYWLISLASVFMLLPPVNAFSFAIRNSQQYRVKQVAAFNARQIVLMIFGAILWFLVLVGLFVPAESLRGY